MNKHFFNEILLLICILSFSCVQNNNISENQSSESIKVNKANTPPAIYAIKGEKIYIRTGPGIQYKKLVNEKATEVLKETQYANVDYSVKVIVLETNGEWSKIKVVVPEWLSDTHIGWIPTKAILKNNSENKEMFETLNLNDYEILKTSHNSAVQNFHVLLKKKGFDKETVFSFIKSFRHEHCTMNCNVNLYDSKSILLLVDKYPLEKNEYLTLADHLVSSSTFDAIDVKDWYPLQDFKYKEYGGMNWKKEPIK
jgi:hypothetical protein